MRRYPFGMRIVLIALAALLALPLAPTASPVEAKRRPRTVTKTFSNTEAIELLTTGNTSPVSASPNYPAPLAVSGLKGKIRDVNLTLHDLGYARPDEIEVLLVGPGGQTTVVMADAGGPAEVNDVTLRLDDEARGPLTIPLRSGAFQPLNAGGGAIAFNAPAPSAGANAALSVFDGTDPNGTWRLFVQDDYGPTGVGYFEGGWELELKVKAKVKAKGKKNKR